MIKSTLLSILFCLPFLSFASDQLPVPATPIKIVDCDTLLNGSELSLQAQYQNVLKFNFAQKQKRFAELRQSVERIVSLVHGRPMDSGTSSNVTILNGQISEMRLSDIMTKEAQVEIVQIIKGLGLTSNSWIKKEGEVMPTENYYGLTSSIVQYEYLLAGFLKGIEDLRGYIAAYALDKMILKHQVFMNLASDLQDAVNHDFTLIGFSFDGLEIPKGYPSYKVVGHEVVVEVADANPAKGETIADLYHNLHSDIKMLENGIETLNKKGSVSRENLPSLYRESSLEIKLEKLAMWLDRFKERAATLLPSKGVYRGIIVKTYQAGFDARIGDKVYSFNVNNNLVFKGIAIHP